MYVLYLRTKKEICGMLKPVSLSRILEKYKCRDEIFFTFLLSSKAKPYNPNSSHSPPIILIFLLLFTHLYFHRNFPSLSLVNFFRRVEISFYIISSFELIPLLTKLARTKTSKIIFPWNSK